MPADLLGRLRAGEPDALAELLDREWGGLVRFLRRRSASDDAAEDAAQEAFVRLWERRERWQAGSARALLYRIGANAVADANRRAGTRARRGREAASRATGTPPTPADDLERSEAGARFHAALEGLAPQRREVFRLVREEALTYREVAEVLELSPQTVANHMSLALRELRTALADLLPRGTGRHAAPADERSSDG